MLIDPTHIVSSLDNEFIKLHISDDDILYCLYKDGISIDTAAAKLVVKDRLSLQNGKEYFAIADMSKTKHVSSGARDYFKEKGHVGLLATALIIYRNRLVRIIGTAFIALSSPKAPIKIFNSVDEARKWVLKMKKETAIQN